MNSLLRLGKELDALTREYDFGDYSDLEHALSTLIPVWAETRKDFLSLVQEKEGRRMRVYISNLGEYGEYRVPGPKGKEEAGAYYTSDRDDAIATARLMYGEEVEIRFRGRKT
jgi:hypothetical protein